MPKAFFDVTPGSEVTYSGQEYVVLHVLDLDRVLARAKADGRIDHLRISDLAPARGETEPAPAEDTDLALVSEAEWRLAEDRLKVIRPLLKRGHQRVPLAEKRAMASKAGVHLSTIYRWIERYEHTAKITSLLDAGRTGGRGKGRLNDEVEAVMEGVIREKYLSRQKLSVEKVHQELELRCRNAALRCPHLNTLRHRINLLKAREKLKAREGSPHASQEFDPRVGQFPDADWPLAVVQIDHSLLDIILLDEVDRLPVGRPWLTLCIDVYSRTVLGFYLSLDPPGTISASQCLVHAMLDKQNWLARLDIAIEWPCWGVMDVVHADNAREFRGNALRRACQNYGIDLQWRRVKTPHYGGHIERLMGTVAGEIHALPGTTFSGPDKRLDYDSTGRATMTLAEIERWLTKFFVGVYHQREHASLGVSPLQRFREGIMGDGRRPGRGVPRKISEEGRLRIDFLPYVERTVQPYGVLFEGLHYYDDVLRPFINSRAPGAKTSAKAQFVFRYDPRDLSVIYFFHPELKNHRAIPYRDTWRPPINVWELRAAHRLLKGRKVINEDLIFETIAEMRDLEFTAGKLTMKVRRQRQRRLVHHHLDVHGAAHGGLPNIAAPAAEPRVPPALPPPEAAPETKPSPPVATAADEDGQKPGSAEPPPPAAERPRRLKVVAYAAESI